VAELLDMLATGGHRPARWAIYVGSLLVFLATCIDPNDPAQSRAALIDRMVPLRPDDCHSGSRG
jgi:hypothetical protein